jgi:hypothetical protein
MERLGYKFPPPLAELHEEICGHHGWKVEYFPVRRHHGFVPAFGYTFAYFNAHVVLVFFNPELNDQPFQPAAVAHELVLNYLNIVQGFPGYRFQIEEGVNREQGVKVRAALKGLLEHSRIDAELLRRGICQDELDRALFDHLYASLTAPGRAPRADGLVFKGLTLVAANLFHLASEKQSSRIMHGRKGLLPRLRGKARQCGKVMATSGGCLDGESCAVAARQILALLGLESSLKLKPGFTA